ncbi:MAG TPA: ClpXP protease specificity-enhancing factor [Aquabacterium sp.]|uniref:ClpXP protease specificity-enhancing factor n=1 Tax=Aquabacterium sp. TaxID=1872578 RepID=UPI002E35C99A|nr:ClpXP protease specificity-enhancing factor [Aquabacterium sp.]HEX5355702.1 ClpXP protease specificity-enhancing factor [Aquabacterium sp.]
MSTEQDSQGSSTRPYLIRALHDWCTDNGFTPYLAVYVDRSVQVPQEYVKNNEIVLNVSFEATSQLQLGNDYIEFKARFGGMARDICVPTDHVIAIYARENGQGMAFPVPTSLGGEGVDSPSSPDDGSDVAVLHATLPADHPAERGPSLKLAKAGKSDGKEPAAVPAPKDRPKSVKPVEVESAPKLVDGGDEPHDPPPTGGGRPALRRIK